MEEELAAKVASMDFVKSVHALHQKIREKHSTAAKATASKARAKAKGKGTALPPPPALTVPAGDLTPVIALTVAPPCCRIAPRARPAMARRSGWR